MRLWEPSQHIQFHLTNRRGTYTLVAFNNDEFHYKTNRSEVKVLPFYYFKCLHGNTLVNQAIVQIFEECMSLETRKSPRVWADYSNHEKFMAFDQMTEDQLHLYFNKPNRIPS